MAMYPVYLKRLAVISVLLLVITASVMIGRLSVNFRLLPRLYVVSEDYDPYMDFTNKMFLIQTHLQEHKGHIGADPYETLIRSGAVGSFYDFEIEGRWVYFNWRTLPIRISTNISDNVHAPLAYISNEKSAQTWVWYLDGQIERINWSNRDSWTKVQFDWDRMFHRAGYPYWLELTERRKWVSEYRDNLAWDSEFRMYVPRTKRSTN